MRSWAVRVWSSRWLCELERRRANRRTITTTPAQIAGRKRFAFESLVKHGAPAAEIEAARVEYANAWTASIDADWSNHMRTFCALPD